MGRSNDEHYSSENQRARAVEYWGTICLVPDCGKPNFKFRLCEEHFVCKIDGCDEPPFTSARLCQMHAARMRRWGTTDDIDHRKKDGPTVCIVDGCSNKPVSRGLCQKHRARFIKFGSMDLPPKPNAPVKVCACGCGETLPSRRSKYVNAEHHKLATRFTKYGITYAIFMAKLKEQGDACAICRTQDIDETGRCWMVDHDHETGAFRGVLCTRCNSGIGYLGDDPERIRAAADYVERHHARRP